MAQRDVAWCSAVLLASTQHRVLHTSKPLNPWGTTSRLYRGFHYALCERAKTNIADVCCLKSAVVIDCGFSGTESLSGFCLQGRGCAVLSNLPEQRSVFRCRWIAKVSHTTSRPLLFFCLQQSAGDAPTTPKYTKEHRDIFFPASLPTPVLLSHTACHPLSTQDSQAKVVYEPLSKLSRPQASGFHDQPQHRRAASHPAAAMAFLPHTGTVASSPTHLITVGLFSVFATM